MPQTILDNRYTRGELLGRGGMAEVYLGHDEVLDRDVALKVLTEQYAKNEEAVERFRREARSAAFLNHPNIVSIYDQGCSEDDTYYIAMEYIPGGTLKEHILGEGLLDSNTATELGLQVARALGHAHERGRAGRGSRAGTKRPPPTCPRCGEDDEGDGYRTTPSD